MGQLIFGQESFSFEQIRTYVPAETTADQNRASVLLFCHEWLNGKDSFTLHTSGSTGAPKPIKLTRLQMELSAAATGQALSLTRGDKALVCLNTSYIAGIMMLVRGMVLDLDLILVPPVSSPLSLLPDPVQLDFAAFVPLQLEMLLQDDQHRAILNQMKAIIVGGAPVSRELEQKLATLRVPVFSTYGMTETVSHIALRKLNGSPKDDYYKTLPGVSIAVDERGCLKIQSPVTAHQWIQTNDRVEIKGNDSFLWLGRADLVINSGGLKIQPEKLERQFEEVLEANHIRYYFIAGLPHPQLGEAVTLFIESTEINKTVLLEQLRPLADRYHLPKSIISLSQFSKTATGKIARSETTEQYQRHYLSGEDQ